MKALPLSTSSKGLRSSAFRLTVGRTRLFFNPGVTASIAGMPLHEARAVIVEAASKADAIFVTGYEPSFCNVLDDLPLQASVYVKAPGTPDEMAAFLRTIAPIDHSGVAVSLGDGARITVGDAEIEWSPWESAISTITVRGDGRTVVYATIPAAGLSRQAAGHLSELQPDLLYVSVLTPVNGKGWAADALRGLAGSLLGLVASTGAQIFVEGLPFAEPAVRRLFLAPLATGRVRWAAEYAEQRRAPVAELALAS